MSRHAARLAKLEAAIPPPKPIVEEDAPGLEFRLTEIMERMAAEEAHFAALSPAGKILSILAKIAEKKAKAALPPPAPRTDLVVDLGPQMHAFLVQDVKNGFRTEHHAMRGYEFAILTAAGYDIRPLEPPHAKWKDYPWQWRQEENPLPPEAQLLIDAALSNASSSCVEPYLALEA